MTNDIYGNHRLWVSVILQAVRDALLPAEQTNSQEALARADARRWLRGGTDDFDQVCELSGIDGERLARWWAGVEAQSRRTSVRQLINEALALAAASEASLSNAA